MSMFCRPRSTVVRFCKVNWPAPVLVRLNAPVKVAAPPLLFMSKGPVPPTVASPARMSVRSAWPGGAPPLLTRAPEDPSAPAPEIVIASPTTFCPFKSSVAPLSIVVPLAVVPKAAVLPICKVPACMSTVPLNEFAVLMAKVERPDFTMLALPPIPPAPLMVKLLLVEVSVMDKGVTVTPEAIVSAVSTGLSSSMAESPAKNADSVLLLKLSQLVAIESHVVSEIEYHLRLLPEPLMFKNTEPSVEVSNVAVKCVPTIVELKLPKRVPE